MRRATELGHYSFGTGTQTLYTAPTGKFAIVKALVWRNYSGGARLYTIHFPVAGADDYAALEIYATASPSSSSGGAIQPYIVVPQGKSLKAEASGTSCAIVAFGVELPE